MSGIYGRVTPIDKSVFFRALQGFEYGLVGGGGTFRDPNSPRLDNGILKVSGNFETSDKRKAFWIIDIHVDDLLISRIDVFIEYFRLGAGKFEAGSYGVGGCVCVWGGKSTYLRRGIEKVSDSDFEGVILDSDNYEGDQSY